jgi:GNAT superfamily N-acetyltransferase
MTGMMIRMAAVDEVPLLTSIDDDACRLYVAAGLDFASPQDPRVLAFVRAEKARWLGCAQKESVYLALEDGVALGFAALERLDGVAHLEQLSVRLEHQRGGLGTTLLQRAIDWARGPLTLTTYGHLPWNAPWYERHGFRRLSESEWSPGLQARMSEERAVLPAPEHRVAMRRA